MPNDIVTFRVTCQDYERLAAIVDSTHVGWNLQRVRQAKHTYLLTTDNKDVMQDTLVKYTIHHAFIG